MIAIEPNQTQLDKQISTLESEILQRDADIQNLQEALATLEANKPRPATPSADNAFELLRQMVGSVPENLEQQGQTLQQIGAELGMSPEQVRQLVVRAKGWELTWSAEQDEYGRYRG